MSNKIIALKSDFVDAHSKYGALTPPASIKYVRFFFRTVGKWFPALGARVAYRLFTTPMNKAKHRRPDELINSAARFDFDCEGMTLQGYSWGKGEKTVLMLHGWRSRGTALRGFVPGLLARGFRVVTFDAPAHGDSPGKRTDISKYARAIVKMMQQLGNVEGIIGHSFGSSASAYALAKVAPDVQVKRLVMIGSWSKAEGTFNRFAAMLGVPDNVITHFRKLMEDCYQMTAEDVDITRFESEMIFEKAMLVHDKQDDVVPYSDALEILEGWEKAVLLSADGYGHYRIIKNPDVVEQIVDFIAS